MKLLFAALALLVFTACGAREAQNPQQFDTIISIGPSITEILAELGFAENIIATDTFSDNIPGISPEIAVLDMMALDLEYIMNLEPDYVFVTGIIRQGGEDDPLNILSNMDISVFYIETSASIAEIKDDIRFIAQTLDVLPRGEEIVAHMAAEIAQIRAISAEIANERTVYFEVSPVPHMVTFGMGTFLHEMLEIAGAVNIFGEREGWFALGDEVILDANPDVILTTVNFIDNPIQEILNRPGWDAITAVQNADVFAISTDSSNRPSHNIILALREIARAVYPEYFNEN
ncbi:MAG: ABC transporter substrate-binding protein [Clostridiales bacterium]|jgi:iron complex transport system substrate-binding protein|nr:ABC transporter substrate-binding protein [Clostridiales bacterium]